MREGRKREENKEKNEYKSYKMIEINPFIFICKYIVRVDKKQNCVVYNKPALYI